MTTRSAALGVLVLATALGACASPAAPAAPAPSATPAAATATADKGLGTAQIEVGNSRKKAAPAGTYTVEGAETDATCSVDDGTATVAVRNGSVGATTPEFVLATVPVGSAAGPGVVRVQFNTTDGGNTLDTDYKASSGSRGSATGAATVDAGYATATFTGTTWDGVTVRGTVSCRLPS